MEGGPLSTLSTGPAGRGRREAGGQARSTGEEWEVKEEVRRPKGRRGRDRRLARVLLFAGGFADHGGWAGRRGCRGGLVIARLQVAVFDFLLEFLFGLFEFAQAFSHAAGQFRKFLGSEKQKHEDENDGNFGSAEAESEEWDRGHKGGSNYG